MARFKLANGDVFENVVSMEQFKQANACKVKLMVKELTKDGTKLKKGDKTAFAVLKLEDGTAESIAVSRNLINAIEKNEVPSDLSVGTLKGTTTEIVFAEAMETGVYV
jgi:hypothetical protein